MKVVRAEVAGRTSDYSRRRAGLRGRRSLVICEIISATIISDNRAAEEDYRFFRVS